MLMLRETGIEVLADTRSHPGSRWPQHRREELEQWIPEGGVGYEWWPNLGGWLPDHAALAPQMLEYGVDISLYLGRGFPKQRIAATEEPVEGAPPRWTNTGLRDYSYFMGLQSFLAAADDLIYRSKTQDIAIMCCECQWWRCHRSMIADYLAFRGVECVHIMPRMRQKDNVKFVGGVKVQLHSDVLGDRLERYEEFTMNAWCKWGNND